MWGNYANKGDGVCLVFDKEKIRELCKKRPYCEGNLIKYNDDYDSSVILTNLNPEKEIWDRRKELFFCKSSQWGYEQEYRIVEKSNNNNAFLDITGCLEGVIHARLGASIDETPYNQRELLN